MALKKSEAAGMSHCRTGQRATGLKMCDEATLVINHSLTEEIFQNHIQMRVLDVPLSQTIIAIELFRMIVVRRQPNTAVPQPPEAFFFCAPGLQYLDTTFYWKASILNILKVYNSDNGRIV